MSTSDYDLPILAELEEEFSRMVAETLPPARPERAAERVAAPRRAPRLQTGRRVLRRAAVAGALVGVVGASALATRSVVDRGTSSTAPVTLHRAAGFELAVRRFQGRLCLDLTYAAGVASRCGPTPGRQAVAPVSALATDRQYVTGLAGTDVARVRVRVNGRTLEAATHALGDAAAAQRLEVSAALRWFVLDLRPTAGRRPTAARIDALDRTGAVLGRPVVDCSAAAAGACAAAIP